MYFQSARRGRSASRGHLNPLPVVPLCTEYFFAKRTSSLRYFSSGMHSGYFSIKTTQELVAQVLPPLLQLWDTPRALWHQDDSRICCARPSSFHFFNSRDALRKKTSQPRIRAEMLDSGEAVEERLVARKEHQACSCYQIVDRFGWTAADTNQCTWTSRAFRRPQVN